ncbi:MAG: aldehyde dehydrogenase family protein [Ilumatobacteraceae bacterium]
MTARLERLEEGQPVVVGGDRVELVSAELADAFRPGDQLLVVQETGRMLHVPAAEHEVATAAVTVAATAFAQLGACSDEAISELFDQFAGRLADHTSAGKILAANATDVERARAAGRSTARLVMTDRMRDDMIAGLHAWRDSDLRRDQPLDRVDHAGWSVQARRAPLGVIGFVFESRPNVFADATGVVRTGNTVVMRIGSDALATAEAIMEHALEPARRDAGLPDGTVSLVRSPARSAGWALFADRRLALAVARGSGAAVTELGAVARQAGTPVSAHGTGGAWLFAGRSADAERFRASVLHSLDRKVCNTLNVCCLPADRPDLVGVLLAGLDEAANERGAFARLHVETASQWAVPAERFAREVKVRRADGDHVEPAASLITSAELGREWEWEASPEISLVVTADVIEAIELFNRHSPRFIASLISSDDEEHRRFYTNVDAPFVGDGFTRWVDGQYAFDTPELGLSNWQTGRLLARGGVVSGASVHTVRHLAHIDDLGVRR